jgi:hypothetical protein
MEIMGKLSKPTNLTQRLVEEAENSIKTSIASIDAFFNTAWNNFRKLAESTPMGLFKE